LCAANGMTVESKTVPFRPRRVSVYRDSDTGYRAFEPRGYRRPPVFETDDYASRSDVYVERPDISGRISDSGEEVGDAV